MGIEVPNHKKTPVYIRSVFESQSFLRMTSPMGIALGKDIAGVAQVADLCKMPHLLIAGSTGSGKSVCVNSIIMSLLFRSSPEDVKLLLIDPKVVELAEYNGIPHLLMPVVTEPRKAAGALGGAVQEMERRYHLFAENNVRDIKSFNKLAATDPNLEKMPYIAIIIDELADLMMVVGKDVEVHLPHRPEGPRRRYAPHRGDPAPQRGRHYRPHQGQHPQPHRLRRVQSGGQPHHPRRCRCRKAAGHGRYALHARGRTQAHPYPGYLRAG